MSEMVSLTGIVLSCIPVAEYDNRIVILTSERGKICAFAKGARRMKNSLLGLTRPFLMARFDLYEGRDAYTLVGGETIEYFDELSKNIEILHYGFYFLEIADYYGREGIEAKDMLNLLYMSFKALIARKMSPALIKDVFEFKAMVLNGEYPELFICNRCHKEKEMVIFSMSMGGLVCDCCPDVYDKVVLSKDTVYTLKYIVLAKLQKLYTFTLSDHVFEEFDRVMAILRKVNFDKHFKSLDLLETMMSL